MTTLQMYLIIISNNIHTISMLLCFVFLLLSIISGIGSIADPDENMRNRCRKMFRYTNCLWMLCLIIFLLVPSSKQCCAVYVMPKIINNQKIDQNNEIYQLSLEWYNELKESKKLVE